jgi:hypothetical protein
MTMRRLWQCLRLRILHIESVGLSVGLPSREGRSTRFISLLDSKEPIRYQFLIPGLTGSGVLR